MKIKSIIVSFLVLIVLACTYFIFTIIKSSPQQESVLYLWDIKDDDLTRIQITLPREGKIQSFIKISRGDEFPWFFDDPQKSMMDSKRWGGGIPLILSGPSVNRIMVEDATDEQISLYGLTKPSMEIILTLKDKSSLTIIVGDSTPNGNNYYVKAPDSRAVATVDFTWYQVLKNLVMDPPYALSSDP